MANVPDHRYDTQNLVKFNHKLFVVLGFVLCPGIDSLATGRPSVDNVVFGYLIYLVYLVSRN